nr:uncharacterized protein LOC123766902 [Procambarus clarkii]
MDGKIVCFCVFLCVVMSSGAPVLQPTPATPEGHQPQHQVLVVKRAALYDRGTGDLPCAGTSFRCVVMSSGAPVLQPTPATPEGHQPQHQVLVVKRAALYDKGTGHLPCASPAYRCPFPDIPAHSTIFNKVKIGN